MPKAIDRGCLGAYDIFMTASPARPEPEIDEETKRILLERMADFEENEEAAVDAKQALREIRRAVQTLKPN